MDFQQETSPWLLQSIYDIQYFLCPEPDCNYKDSSKHTFVCHAYEFHPEAIDFLNDIQDGSLTDIDLPWNLNLEKDSEVDQKTVTEDIDHLETTHGENYLGYDGQKLSYEDLMHYQDDSGLKNSPYKTEKNPIMAENDPNLTENDPSLTENSHDVTENSLDIVEDKYRYLNSENPSEEWYEQLEIEDSDYIQNIVKD